MATFFALVGQFCLRTWYVYIIIFTNTGLVFLKNGPLKITSLIYNFIKRHKMINFKIKCELKFINSGPQSKMINHVEFIFSYDCLTNQLFFIFD